jgi:hypothetical protein
MSLNASFSAGTFSSACGELVESALQIIVPANKTVKLTKPNALIVLITCSFFFD